MKNFLKSAGNILIAKDFWIYLTIIVFVSLGHPKGVTPENWLVYFGGILKLSLIFLPFFFLDSVKTGLKKRLKTFQYYTITALVLVAYPIIILAIQSKWLFPTNYDNGVFFSLSIIFAFIFIILETQAAFKKKDTNLFNWFNKLGLDMIILIVLLLFAIFVASLTTSDLQKFYETRATSISIDLKQILLNFPSFVSIIIQIYIAYLGGFFFYYINRHLLIPVVMKERGVLVYLMSVFATVMFCYPIIGQLIMWLPMHQKMQVLTPSEDMNPFHGMNAAIAFAIMGISLPITIALQWFEQHYEISSLEKEKSETELSLLKQQINPHFFFNTLNNLYSLSLLKSEKTPEVIMQLSELMRYVIYKGKQALVPLHEDIKYIEDYIRLQQIRLRKKLELDIKKDIADNTILIPPMLFIILVENAFKHGIEPAENTCYLNIKIRSNNNKIVFECENSIELKEEKEPGIGLSNLRRRLSLLYPDNHELEIIENETKFKASLIVKI